MRTLSLSHCLSRNLLQVIAATRFLRMSRLSVVKKILDLGRLWAQLKKTITIVFKAFQNLQV